jgi:polynucleotide 5'-hydroxyl-kinase GRC3/NOL9
VAILDLDSGQPKFSPPGLLTLSIVSKPIMSDPPMHIICIGQGCKNRDKGNATNENGVTEKVIASYFSGDITSKADPNTYIHIANKLMGDEYSQTPLIVNTDGWVKGLGYKILSAIIGMSNPAHIVQILGNTKAKSFDLTSFHYANDDNPCSRCVHTIQSFDKYSNPVLDCDDNKRGSLDSQSVLTGPLLVDVAICNTLSCCNTVSTIRAAG